MYISLIIEGIIYIYGVAVLGITIYSLGQLHLLYFYTTRDKKGRVRPEKPEINYEDLPPVTVQLPMYNERYVAEAVIDASAKIDYPADKLEIQVVDDSTDETVEIARERVEYWQEQGVDIKLVHRENRQGFKAGALRDATPSAKGEFIAVFDADFRPKSTFLMESIPYFQDEEVGVVQGRWGHINRDYSVLTKSQSIFLDMFFVVEQGARALADYFLRFNGSGGIWRKECIEDAGGWSADTLSEDLDLCFRAQLKDWKIVYDGSIVSPAEIPVAMLDFKAQQYRWTKGKAQVIKKLGKDIRKKKMPRMKKLHVYFDLFNIFAIPCILILALFSIPLIFILMHYPEHQQTVAYFSLGLINVVIAPGFAWHAIRIYNDSTKSTFKDLLKSFPAFVCVIIGIILFQTISMIDGFFSNKSFFHRTSKYNITDKTDSWRDKVYSPKEVPLITYFEGLLALYFLAGIIIDIKFLSFGFLPFHIILFVGFAYVFYTSFRKT